MNEHLKACANVVNTHWFFYMDEEEDSPVIYVYFIKVKNWFNTDGESPIVKPTCKDILGIDIIAPIDDKIFADEENIKRFMNHAYMTTEASKEEIAEVIMEWGFLNLNAVDELDEFLQREMDIKHNT